MPDKKEKTRGLGRGLSALMGDVSADYADGSENADSRPADRMVPIEAVSPNPDQPRRTFDMVELEELASSISEKGIIQPLIVRSYGEPGQYQIVAGERRWRAAQMAKLHEIPVLVREFSDTDVLEIAIIENIQRADLNPIEEAAGYRQLMDRFGHTQEQISSAMGKSRSHIANLLRLLQLPDEVQGFLRDGQLTAGHARALITAEDPLGLARQVIARGLSVRETEALAKAPKVAKTNTQSAPAPIKDADTRVLEGELGAHLGMRVEILHKDGADGGQLRISYKSLEQLDDLCRLLGSG